MPYFIVTAVLTGLLALSGNAVHAQQHQVPPLRLLVGFSAGGSLDAVARALAERLRATLNQAVVVENKPGASQRIALGEIRRAKADEPVLMLANNAPFTLFPHIYKTLGYDPVADFTPIGQVATYDLGVAAGPKAPAGGIREFLDWARANPQDADYGTGGAGQPAHFIGDMISKTTGVALTHVPYKGGAPALTDLAGGQIPILIDTLLESMEMAKGGKVRILATTGSQRLTILPDVPTLRESGIDVVTTGYLALYGPPGMSQARVKRLEQALADALQSPALASRIVQFAMTPAYASASDLARFQAASLADWAAPVKATGFTAD